MFGLFKSAAQRKAESDRDYVVEMIVKSVRSARQEIVTLHERVEPRFHRAAAVTTKTVVVQCDRMQSEIEMWQARAEQAERQGRLFRAIGISLGTRLLVCDLLLRQLKGKEWSDASFALPELEGLLMSFLTANQVETWPVSFLFEGDFEKYRQSELSALAERNARVEAGLED